MSTTTKIVQLKIILVGFKPVIWRRILVPANYSFFDLHVATQDSFGWYDQHLHHFFTDSPYKRNPRYEELALPIPSEMEDVTDERKIKLSKYLNKPKDAMFYEYDFGDSWMHEIKVEKVISPEPKAKYPQIIDGANARPLEDCGGIGGYHYLLEVLKDPKHEEYDHSMEWLEIDDPSELDPKQFDIKSVKFRDPEKVLKEHEEGFGI
jgi:hypothetical protein